MTDDVDETLQSLTARINAGIAKVDAARRADEARDGVPGQATGEAFVEFEDAIAEMRRDLLADLLQARQLEDIPRCAKLMAGLLKLKPLEQAIAGVRSRSQPPS